MERSQALLAESAASYFQCERGTLAFLRSRVATAEKELAKVTAEAQSMSSMGISLKAVLANLEKKAEELRSEIAEDRGAVAHFVERAKAVYATAVALSKDVVASAETASTCAYLAQVKALVPTLEIPGLTANEWNPPVAQASLGGSPKPFDSNKAASLGLAALLPRQDLAPIGPPAVAPASAAPGPAKSAADEEQKKKKMTQEAAASESKQAAPKAPKAPAPAIKFSWASKAPAAASGPKKSMMDIQAEEEQDRLTKENLKRIEAGKSDEE